MTQYYETRTGFRWGAATVTRVTEHEGHVVLEISPLCGMQLGRSPNGWARHSAGRAPCPATERQSELPSWEDRR